MKTRRGSSLWPETDGLSSMIYRFEPGDLVVPVAVKQEHFLGVVKEVLSNINKVMVLWNGGSLKQHDPDEIMLEPHQNEIVRTRMASSRRVKGDAAEKIANFESAESLNDRGCRKLSADDVATGPQFVGDPSTHGIDKPRGGGFSIMQDLQKDLHKEMKKESEAGPKVAYSQLKSRRAMYWGAPERVYRLTKNEQENGTAICPKCKKQMSLEPFTKSEKLYNCPSCGFKVPSSKTTTTRITIDVDKGTGEVDVGVTTARRGRKSSLAKIARYGKVLKLTLNAGGDIDIADLEDEITAVLKNHYDGKHVSSKKSGRSWVITWEISEDASSPDVINRVKKIPEWKSTKGMNPRWGK